MALRSDPLLIGVNYLETPLLTDYQQRRWCLNISSIVDNSSLLRIQGNLGKKNGTCVLLNVCSMAVSSQYMLAEPFTVFVMLN